MQTETTTDRIVFLGSPVDRITIPQTLQWITRSVQRRQPRFVAVVNANKYYLMARNGRLKEIITRADLILPEYATVWGARKLRLPNLHHSGGLLLTKALLPYAAEKGIKLYLLGARPEVVSAAARRVQIDHPSLRIAGFHHGYLQSAEATASVIRDIRRTEPEVLLVAMGSPMQEFWIDSNKREAGIPVNIGVGGSFDILSGMKPDTPDWTRGRGLEWLFRLALEPKAYFRRYLVTNFWFVWQVIRGKRRA